VLLLSQVYVEGMWVTGGSTSIVVYWEARRALHAVAPTCTVLRWRRVV
jgi:hypothetical protein